MTWLHGLGSCQQLCGGGKGGSEMLHDSNKIYGLPSNVWTLFMTHPRMCENCLCPRPPTIALRAIVWTHIFVNVFAASVNSIHPCEQYPLEPLKFLCHPPKFPKIFHSPPPISTTRPPP